MSEKGLGSPKALDDLCEIETLEHQHGYAAGIRDSKNFDGPGLIAINEGAHLGHHRGVSLGLQIGYYLGVINYYESDVKKTPEKYNEKTIKQLSKLKELIESFPTKNVERDIDALTSDIHAQYKKLCSLLKIKPFNSDANIASF